MNIAAGDRLGDWVVVGKLGAGGMGSVYRCHSTLSADVRAAVKVLEPNDLGGFESRFVAEMRTLAGLSHPAIVKVLGGGRDERRGLLYMAMELVDGENLEHLLRGGPLPSDRAIEVFAPVADALEYVHKNGVAHRDIKPANIMIRRDGTPVIVDFGIAVADDGPRHTTEGAVPGTLAYMPPEAFQGVAPDPRSTDAYALGVVMWEAVTGKTAFSTPPNTSDNQRMVLVMGQKLRSDALDPGDTLAKPLRDAILRTTDPEPESRLVDLAEVRRLLLGESTLANQMPRRKAKGRRWGLILGVLATLAVVGVGGAALGSVGLVAAGGAAYWATRGPAVVVAPVEPPVDLAEALREGTFALERGDLGVAWDHAGAAIDDHPEDPYANLLYGQVVAKRGDLALARPYLCAAVDGGLREAVPPEILCDRGPGGATPLTGALSIAKVDLGAPSEPEAGDDRRVAAAPAPEPASPAASAPAPAAPAVAAPSAPAPGGVASAPRTGRPRGTGAKADDDVLGEGLGAGGAGGAGTGGGLSGLGAGAGESVGATPRVTVVSVESTYTDPAAAKRLLALWSGRLGSCAAGSAARGRLAVVLEVDADGHVSSVEVTTATIDAATRDCAVNAMKRWRFPTGDATEITASFVFDVSG